MKQKLLSILILTALLCSSLTVRAAQTGRTDSVAEAEDLCGGIVAYQEAACGASGVQEWIDTGLCAAAGTVAEFYVITLSQSGSYDFSRYERALLAFLDSHKVSSAATREKYALALLACGSTDGYIQRVCDNDIGELGLMSLVFGLHLLNNGCTSRLYTADALIGDILSRQLADGGWAVIGDKGDPDVTAMTLQALAPYYGGNSDVTASVDSALNLLGSLQLDSGGFKSMGKENCESAAQVLTALSALGIEQRADPRFIKNGRTVLDAMRAYRNSDGSFSHAGDGFSENATIQAYYSLRAYLRMRYGQSPLYILDRRPSPVQENDPVPAVRPSEATPPTVPETPTAAPTQAPAADPATQPAPEPSETDSAPTQPGKTYPTEPPHGDYLAPTGDRRFQSENASLPLAAVSSTPDEAPSKGGYKLYAILGVLSAAAVVCVILLLKKKRGVKHYLPVLILAGAAIAFVLLTNFESREAYARVEEKADPGGTVTMTISCGVLNAEDDKPFSIPEDGVILPETVFTIGEDTTVYDVLLEASKRYDIRIDNRGAEGSAYIAGIQYLYELEYGSLSGWMYRVNGTFPDVGCQGCRLRDGDRIEWLYTREIGRDL